MAWPWFGPITNNSLFSTLFFFIYAKSSCCCSVVTEFGYTLDQVNWLGNITSVIYLPVALLVPTICARWNVRRCVRVDNFLLFWILPQHSSPPPQCDVGALCMIVSAWVRYAGTVPGLSPGKSYAIVLIGQVIVSFPQPMDVDLIIIIFSVFCFHRTTHLPSYWGAQVLGSLV